MTDLFYIASRLRFTFKNVLLTKSLCCKMRGTRGCVLGSLLEARNDSSSSSRKVPSTCFFKASNVYGKYCWWYEFFVSVSPEVCLVKALLQIRILT